MFFYSQLLSKHGVKALFSDREGGCSEAPFDSLNLGFELGDDDRKTHGNFKLLCHKSGVNPPHQARQVHGKKTLFCAGKGKLHDTDADVLITSVLGTTVGVRTADCLPILLADKNAGVVAAVHAGWKGTVAQVAQEAVREMCDLGAEPENIVASLGPCIASCCFEVNADIAQKLKQSCGKNITHNIEENIFADLKKTNIFQLLTMGITNRHIEVSHCCTSCNVSPSYFSYRRDKGITGRHISLIMLA